MKTMIILASVWCTTWQGIETCSDNKGNTTHAQKWNGGTYIWEDHNNRDNYPIIERQCSTWVGKT